MQKINFPVPPTVASFCAQAALQLTASFQYCTKVKCAPWLGALKSKFQRGALYGGVTASLHESGEGSCQPPFLFLLCTRTGQTSAAYILHQLWAEDLPAMGSAVLSSEKDSGTGRSLSKDGYFFLLYLSL